MLFFRFTSLFFLIYLRASAAQRTRAQYGSEEAAFSNGNRLFLSPRDIHGSYSRFLEVSENSTMCPNTITHNSNGELRPDGYIHIPLHEISHDQNLCRGRGELSIRFRRKITSREVFGDLNITASDTGIQKLTRDTLLALDGFYYGTQTTSRICHGSALPSNTAFFFTSDVTPFINNVGVPFPRNPKIMFLVERNRVCGFSSSFDDPNAMNENVPATGHPSIKPSPVPSSSPAMKHVVQQHSKRESNNRETEEATQGAHQAFSPTPKRERGPPTRKMPMQVTPATNPKPSVIKSEQSIPAPKNDSSNDATEEATRKTSSPSSQPRKSMSMTEISSASPTTVLQPERSRVPAAKNNNGNDAPEEPTGKTPSPSAQPRKSMSMTEISSASPTTVLQPERSRVPAAKNNNGNDAPEESTGKTPSPSSQPRKSMSMTGISSASPTTVLQPERSRDPAPKNNKGNDAQEEPTGKTSSPSSQPRKSMSMTEISSASPKAVLQPERSRVPAPKNNNGNDAPEEPIGKTPSPSSHPTKSMFMTGSPSAFPPLLLRPTQRPLNTFPSDGSSDETSNKTMDGEDETMGQKKSPSRSPGSVPEAFADDREDPYAKDPPPDTSVPTPSQKVQQEETSTYGPRSPSAGSDLENSLEPAQISSMAPQSSSIPHRNGSDGNVTPPPTPSLKEVILADSTSTCFPSSAMVTLQTGKRLRMDELRVGHAVTVGRGQTSDVVDFSHADSNVFATYVHMNTVCGRNLTVTPPHFVYTNRGLIPAADIVMGDLLKLENGALTRVSHVSLRRLSGLFNPHTLHGDIAVDGFVVSTYTLASQPMASHALLTPLRFLYELGVRASVLAKAVEYDFLVASFTSVASGASKVRRACSM